ncbi:MAG: 30S ribosomal protein S16 [Lentisphaeria bacterium]|nr:30S ribosomal protein S16 [Lentisphaeria bacterium]
MAVKIRLRRVGKRNAPAHRIVVADSRSPRDGRFIEILGQYDPRNKTETIDLERAEYWLGEGAQASETVQHIIERAKSGKVKEQKAAPVMQAKAPKVQAQPDVAADTAEEAPAEAEEVPAEAEEAATEEKAAE